MRTAARGGWRWTLSWPSRPQASAQARLCPPPVSPRPRAAGVMGLPLVGTGHHTCPQARSPLEGGVTLRVPSLSRLVFLVTSSPPLTKSHPESLHADERGSWWSCHLGVHKSFESSASWGSRWGKGSGDTPKAGHPESPSPTAAHSIHPAPPAPSPSGSRWGSAVPAGSSGSRSEREAWGAPKATP